MWRRKIISILLGIILLLGVFPHPIQGKDSLKNIPKWNVGDKWVYDGGGNYSIEESDGTIRASASINDLTLQVDEIRDGDYILTLTGDIHLDAYVKIESISLETTINFNMGKIEGMLRISENNLEIEKFMLNVSGVIVISLAPLPLPFKAGISIEFVPGWKILDFPLATGKEWNTSASTMLFNVSEDLFNFIESLLDALSNFLPPEYRDFLQEIIDMVKDMLPLEIDMPVAYMKCEGERDVKVRAGTYHAFLISVEDILPIYFAESLANFIKLNYSQSDYAGDIDAKVELTSTDYSPPGAPEKPSKPSGAIRIRKGKEYEYSTVTTDSNGSMISYGWDWDGDMVVDEWSAFYPSGEEITMSHAWKKRGKYEVRVKARNEYGLESKWSEPLMVKTWLSFTTPHRFSFTNLFSDYLLHILYLHFSRET